MKTRLLTTAILLFSLHALRAAAVDTGWISKDAVQAIPNSGTSSAISRMVIARTPAR